MTEKTLFRNTLITLGSTIVLPLIIGLTGIAALDGKSTQQLIKSYIAAAAPVASASDQTKIVQDGVASEASEPATDMQDKTASSGKAESTNGTAANGYAPVKPAGTYTVQSGDTYGCIAEKYYGSYDQWSRVYAVNAGWPGFEEYHLHVGAVLQMPAVTAAEILPPTSLCSK